MLHAVIMAGGSGTRFWPASRADRPKQLLDLTGDGSMLQNTVRRLEGMCSPDQIMIMTNQRLTEPIRKQLPNLPASSVVGEPFKRDTAPCIGWAAHLIRQQDPEGLMVVMPADHVIQPRDKFQAAMQYASKLVEENPQRIVTFGIRPTYPAVTFGYVERGEWLTERDELLAAPVRQFREKPDSQTAQRYLDSGRFYWNSGIFVWKAATIIDAIERFEPEMGKHLAAIGAAIGASDEADVLNREFGAIDGTSIDYAVMERYDEEICVIEAPFEWDDLGGWQASARLLGEDSEHNTRIGRTLAIDSSGCIIRSTDDHVVVTLGMKDCIVVHTPDATLVANKNDEESIREVVKQLQELGYESHL